MRLSLDLSLGGLVVRQGGEYVPPAFPGAINDLEAVAISTGAIVLAWTAASGATSHEYRRRVSADAWGDWTATIASDEHTITGLDAETGYDFQVRGVNADGPGPASNVASETTEAEEPGEPGDLATPLLIENSSYPQLAGDTRPIFSIDAQAPYPAGVFIGDTIAFQWGLSEAAAIAMTPSPVEFDEAWLLDDVDPSPGLAAFCAAQALGATVHYRIKGIGGAHRPDSPPLESAWSNFRTLTIADGVMDAPSLSNLTGQTASTRVWSASFNPAGLGSGAYARLKGTGPIERTRGGTTVVFEAGQECAVAATDSLRFGVDTGSSAGQTVGNAVTNRGAALTTFTAAVAGSAVNAIPSATPAQRFTRGNTTPWNAPYPGVDFATGLAVVAIVGMSEESIRNITGVTIGGVAASRIDIHSTANGDYDWWAAPVVAGAHDVLVSYDGNNNTMDCAFFTLTNTSAASAGGFSYLRQVSSTNLTVPAMTIGTDGLGVAVFSVDSPGAPVSITNGEEVGRWTLSNGRIIVLAKQVASGQTIVAATSSSSTTQMRQGAVFAKVG